MKGVLRARACPAREAGRGPQRCGPLSCIRRLPDAERGWCRAVFAAVIARIVHGSSKSGDNVREPLKTDNRERFRDCNPARLNIAARPFSAAVPQPNFPLNLGSHSAAFLHLKQY